MGDVVGRTPTELVLHACRWIKRSPERWERLLALCEWFYARYPGHRLRRGEIWNLAQQQGMSVTLCDKMFRFDNSMWSVLSRYAIMCVPHLKEVIRTRSSGVDMIDLRAAWEAVGLDPSCFAVDDWRLA